jgi:FAD:protein FMN transferase
VRDIRQERLTGRERGDRHARRAAAGRLDPASGAGAEVRFPVWGTTALLVVTDPDALEAAEALLRAELAALDQVCNRFRPDSEISLLRRGTGASVRVTPLLADVLDVALRAAYLTDGLVDPTVGAAMDALGYDRDFAAVPADGPATTATPAPGWWRIGWDRASRTLVLPTGVVLDVGATAKAWAADRASDHIAAEFGCGVLVCLGGDMAVAGQAPACGWRVQVADDHTYADPEDGQSVALTGGGLATSDTARRRWRRGGRLLHHIVDPFTGAPADCGWRTVSVAAGRCVDANTASTAALLFGPAAPGWLRQRGLAARLVTEHGDVHTVSDWPPPLLKRP